MILLFHIAIIIYACPTVACSFVKGPTHDDNPLLVHIKTETGDFNASAWHMPITQE
jgi:hypothetical protein